MQRFLILPATPAPGKSHGGTSAKGQGKRCQRQAPSQIQAGRRGLALRVNAFISQGNAHRQDAFPEPLEYAGLLGLQGRESNLADTQIIAAYEHLSASPLEAGYSKLVEEGRTVLLHAAVDGCRDLRVMAMRSDRQSPALQEARQAMVQWWLLPAALSLLQETEQSEAVLELGKEALSRREGQAYKRDILLSMALAHCTLASNAFEGRDKIRLGCAHLEEALALLGQAGLTGGMSKLAVEIREGLRQLKPDCLIEHLKVTEAGEARGERRQAIDVLKALLADPQLALKADGTSGVGREFVKQSLVSLTSLETVNLLDWQDIAKNGANISWYFDGLLRRGALAHIVAGFVHRRPSLIEQGSALLLGHANNDMLMERVVSCVLLADTQTASHLLIDAEKRGYFHREANRGDGQGGSPASTALVAASDVPPRSETLNFIRSHSPDGDYDLLPGIILFTERWLAQVAFQRFKDTADGQASPSVNDYYEDEAVMGYLSVKTRDDDSLMARLRVSSDTLKHSLQRMQEAPLSSRNAQKHKSTRLPKLELPGGSRASQGSPFSEWLGSVKAPGVGQVATAGLLLVAVVFAVATKRGAGADALQGLTTTESMEEKKQPQVQESSQPPKVRRWRAPWQQDNKKPTLRPRAAEASLRRWQVAKQMAMGPRHDDSLLTATLADPYLAGVRKDVASAKKAGWFWSYRLSDLYVENVDNSGLTVDGGGEAVVTARLRERGELFAITGKRADDHCYDNSYRAEYSMVREADNTWRISRVLVLGED